MSSNEKFEREFEAFLNEDDSHLAALYRKLPQAEPDARLDAAVHAMAQRASNPQRAETPRATIARRRASRWMPALGAAAAIVLAAGIAFRLGPSLNDTSYRDAAPAKDVINDRPADAPAPAVAPPLPPPPAAPVNATGAPRAQAAKPEATTLPAAPPPAPASVPKATAIENPQKAKLSALAHEQRSATPTAPGGAAGTTQPAPAPRPFPAETRSPRQGPEIDAVEHKQIMTTGAQQKLHERDARDTAADATRERSLDDKADAGAIAPPSARIAKPALAPAAPPPAATAAAPALAAPPSAKDVPSTRSDRNAPPLREAPPQREEPRPVAEMETAVPQPAGAARGNESADLSRRDALKKERAKSADPNARLYPEHWLANIRTMLAQERRDEALRSLAEFRRLYPDYTLPDDLRDLK